MTSLDFDVLAVLVETHVFSWFLPGNVYMFIDFVSWGYKNVISGEVHFVVTDSELCKCDGVVT